LLLRLIERF